MDSREARTELVGLVASAIAVIATCSRLASGGTAQTAGEPHQEQGGRDRVEHAVGPAGARAESGAVSARVSGRGAFPVSVVRTSLKASAAQAASRRELPAPSHGDAGKAPAAPTHALAYVSLAGGQVSAVDVRDQRLVWTLRISEGSEAERPRAASGIAATRDGSRVFAADAAKRQLVVIDPGEPRAMRRIPLGHAVEVLELGPQGRRLWLAGPQGGRRWLSEITVLDPETWAREGRFASQLGRAVRFVFPAAEGEVWTGSSTTGLVWAYDGASGDVVSTVALDVGEGGSAVEQAEGRTKQTGVRDLAMDTTGTRMFAVGSAGRVFAVDVEDRQVTAEAQLEDTARALAVTPDGNQLWVAHETRQVSILEPESLSVVGEVQFSGAEPAIPAVHVAFTPDGEYALTTWRNMLAVLDVDTRALRGAIGLGAVAQGITLGGAPR